MKVKQDFTPVPEELDRIGTQIVDAAFNVHKRLGPGLLESTYEICLMRELEKRGLKVERQVPVAIEYEGIRIMRAYEMDLLVESQVIVELKSVEALSPKHYAQLRTHIRLAGRRLGYLINFDELLIRDGIKRIVVG